MGLSLDFDNLSSPSSREFILNNLNSELSHNGPLLLEEKVQALFSKFLSELSETIETIPGTLLESCVQNFKQVLNVSIIDIFREEFMPQMLDQFLSQMRECAKERPSGSTNEFEQLRKLIEEKMESVQDKLEGVKDLILVNESQCHSNMDTLGKNLDDMEDKMYQKLSSLENQMSDLQTNGHNRFEQTKRRFSDISSVVHQTNTKLETLVNDSRDCPPHLNYNNPLLNVQSENNHNQNNLRNPSQYDSHRPPPAMDNTPLPESHQSARANFSKSASNENIPTANDEFPYIDHGSIDFDMRRELWKSIPKNSEWDKFSGELPYNHELWIKNTDILVRDYLMLDNMIISRLTKLLTDTARNWYLGIRDKYGNKSWAWWKNAIRNKFGTENWKWKMQQEFENDHFAYDGRKIHKWFGTQRERLKAYQPELSEYLICEKILKQCPPNLEHAVKSRYKRDATEMSFEDMVIIAEEVIDRVMKRNKPVTNNYSAPNRSQWRNNPVPEKADKPNESSARRNPASAPEKDKLICHFCKQTGHFSRECPKKKNRINNVGMDDDDDPKSANGEDQGERQKSGSELDEEEENHRTNHMILAMDNGTGANYDPLVDFDFGAHAVECEINQDFSIAEIQAETHQPQTWDKSCQSSHVEDARLMKCKPDRGKAHLTGKANLTTVLIESKEHSCLLDSGASCSIISNRLLDSIIPEWENKLMPINHAKFHSCSD
ncbi:hypothetical protein PtB15_5B702 [Puccinia triticina]|nr:hypothetical protein PtB15_5B702 [Puccinia triticina]